MMILAAICVLAVGVSAQVGHSGIVSPDGVNTQFSHEFANDIVLIGPSGIVTKSGVNRQLTGGEATLHAAAPAPMPVAQMVTQKGVFGNSGIVMPDGNNVQFTQEQADNIVLVGPSGVITKDGTNMQLNDQGVPVRAKRHTIGASGMILDDGTPVQFPVGGLTILYEGPSGIILSDGTPVQKRSKRSAGVVSSKGNVGYSGILRADGSTDLFSHDFAHDIVLIGPAGIVTKSGHNVQLTDDLRMLTRNKRALIGPSGMITDEGVPIQFPHQDVTVLLDGPSGMVLSDGSLIQKRPKRAIVGDSGIITPTGKLIQLEPGVSVVLAGPSGIILSNGKNIQY